MKNRDFFILGSVNMTAAEFRLGILQPDGGLSQAIELDDRDARVVRTLSIIGGPCRKGISNYPPRNNWIKTRR